MPSCQDGVWSSIGEIVINESDFTVEKDAGGKGGHWYDVINLFHLTYYFVTPAERAELFRRLHSLLAPGGAVHFLNVAERTGEELNPQFLMYKELGGIMTAAGIATKSRVDWNTADVLWREYAAVADGFGMTRRMKTLPVQGESGVVVVVVVVVAVVVAAVLLLRRYHSIYMYVGTVKFRCTR